MRPTVAGSERSPLDGVGVDLHELQVGTPDEHRGGSLLGLCLAAIALGVVDLLAVGSELEHCALLTAH